MKEYKKGDIVSLTVKEFDGVFRCRARVIKADKDFAIAEEIGSPNPMHLYIDEDTDFMYRKEYR